MTLRILAKITLVGLALLASHSNAAAQEYPNRSVKIVVGYPPGGSVDANARLLGQLLSEYWKQPVVVENRAGAGSTIATASVAQATPDGYTILLASPAHTINATLYKKLPYDTASAFAAVTKLSAAPLILLVHPSVQAKSVGELIALMAGTTMQHIPYHGGSPALTALLSGDIQVMFAGVEGLAHVRSGKLHALASTASQRGELFKELPTVAESGLPGFDVETWYGIYLPAATPLAIVNQLNHAVNQVSHEPANEQRFRKLGFEVFQTSPEQFLAFTRSELKKWREVIQASGATLD